MELGTLVKNAASCCGCGACLSVCPRQAISMKTDPYGCKYPIIDPAKCIDCGLCVRICQYTTLLDGKTPMEAYAAVGCCGETVMNSASGGVFASLAESAISKGELVAGAVMDCRNGHAEVYHLLSGDKSDLCRMQGSKYVQSDAWRSYSEIREAVNAGKKVLFSGTPCQVAAVKAITGNPENLMTVDLICHGVPPLQMLNDYLKILSKRFRGEITAFRFREKSCSKQYTAGIYVCRGKKTERVLIKSSLLSFYKYFLDGAFHRENCFSCPYAESRRVADITIGDYWGVEECHAEELCNGKMPRRNDWSCVMVNTEKGERLLQDYGEALLLYPSRLEWVALHNQQLKMPASKGKKRDQLLGLYRKSGYEAVEAEFIRENGGRLRFIWRAIRNIRGNKRKTI